MTMRWRFRRLLLLLASSGLLLAQLSSGTSTKGRKGITPKREMIEDREKVNNTNPGDRDNFVHDGYWGEFKAIIGGVLGFWGGVVGLGMLMLVAVFSHRYCCNANDDDKEHVETTSNPRNSPTMSRGSKRISPREEDS